MLDLIRATAFGSVVRTLSGGRLLDWPENHDEKLRQSYLHSNSRQASTTAPGRESDVSLSIPNEKLDRVEKGSDALLIDWVEGDPQNPRNWSLGKKSFVTFDLCLLTTSVYIGSAIYTAGLRDLQIEFGMDQTTSLLGLTLYVLGYGLGPMLFAPLSEVPFFGRNKVYLGTLFIFVFLNFGVVYAKNIGMLLAFRFLTGFFGSPVLATGGATLADIYRPSKSAYPFAFYGIANVLGPVMGPLIGGFAAEAKGWKWTIWILMWLSGFCFVFLFFTFPETSAGNLLYTRTQRLRKHLGKDGPEIECQPEIEARGMTPREGMMMTFVRPFTLTFGEPILLVLNMYIALVYALLYIWLESIPLAFIGVYHFSLGITGLAYCGILVGAFITVPVFFVWNYYWLEPKFSADGQLQPELRMPPAFIGAFCIPICLFMFGWSARPDVHWIVPIIGTSFFSIGAFCLFAAILTYIGDAYPAHIASVYAGNDLFRSVFGASFPLFANALFARLGLDWGNSLLGFISILFIPAPFVIYYTGKAIRLRSKMARHDM